MSLVYRHENALKYVLLAIALLLWGAVLWTSKGLALLYVVFFALFYLFAQSAFIAHLRGTGVLVGPEQYPDVHAAHVEACEKLGIAPVPECYVLRTNTFNALATRFLGRNFVVLFADVVETLREHPESLTFYIGHELGHLARRHLQWHPLLLPATFLPLVGAAHRRAQEYTCDLHGLACSPDLGAAQRGLIAIAAPGSRLAATNVAAYATQVESTRRFWMSFHELIGDYPWLTKRVAHVTAAAGGTTPAFPRRHFFAWVLACIVPRTGVGAAASPLIAVAIVGVLAAIAIPAYQDYTIRSQVMAGLNASAEYKAAVAAAGATSVETLREVNDASLQLEPREMPAYVASIAVDYGVIVIKYGNGAAQSIDAAELLLVPAIAENGAIAWICGRADVPEGYTAALDDYPDYTTLPDKYLPSACRTSAG